MTSEINTGVLLEQKLQDLILDEELEHLEDLLAEFNLFDVLKIERREPQHSALLGWLLNPKGSHGLRDYFLRRFLSAAAAKAHDEGISGVTPVDVDGWQLTNMDVATERHNIDILLISQDDEFACIVENKIGASEHSNQLNRYLTVVEREYEGLVPFPIFLTPDGIEPESESDAERYVALGYEEVASLVDRTLKTRGSTISASVAGFLEQYALTLRRHVMTTTNDNIDALALQIYQNHREAIDLIIRAKPAFEARGWDILDSTMAQHERFFQPDINSKWYHRFYAPELEEISDLHEGNGWTTSGRMLLFEVKYRERVLGMVLGPGPESTRRRLYGLTLTTDAVPDVKMRRTKKLSGTWHTLYSCSLLDKGGSAEPDYELGKHQVDLAVRSFLDKDYWPLVNAIREEFGLPPAPSLNQLPVL